EWYRGQEGKQRFLWVHVYDPHAPYDPPQAYKERYKDDFYLGEVSYTDAAPRRDGGSRRSPRRSRRADARSLLLRSDAPRSDVRVESRPRPARQRRGAGAPHRHPADDARRDRRSTGQGARRPVAPSLISPGGARRELLRSVVGGVQPG